MKHFRKGKVFFVFYFFIYLLICGCTYSFLLILNVILLHSK
ncbi:hypothetical protein X975_24381, partial [Stegodyphus mimosarum]